MWHDLDVDQEKPWMMRNRPSRAPIKRVIIGALILCAFIGGCHGLAVLITDYAIPKELALREYQARQALDFYHEVAEDRHGR